MSYVIAAYKHGPYPVAFAARFGDVVHSRHHAVRLTSYTNARLNRDWFKFYYPTLRWTIMPMPGGAK